MQVTQMTDGRVNPSNAPKPTNDEMQNEYDYILAEQLTRKLLDKGLISVDEFNKIMAKNREIFSLPVYIENYTLNHLSLFS